METGYYTLLATINKLQERIRQHRPLAREAVLELKEDYRIVLTYSSNALEGNALTLSETKAVLEEGVTIGGRPIRDHLEAIGHSKAFDDMYSLIDSDRISENDILMLHKLFYMAIEPEKAGVYRNCPVQITGSEYPVPEHKEIAKLMQKFVTEMYTVKSKLHPVEYAARIHKELVFIHPFIDGNGRVARLLMNLTLLRRGYPVLIIPKILRQEYIRRLEQAHKDDRPLIGFVAEQLNEAQRDYIRQFHI
jgi:Fic family protein